MTPVELMELALQKRASATPTNHEHQITGKNTLYPDPAERAETEGTLSASWGQDPHQDKTHNSTGVWDEYLKAHHLLLKGQFSDFNAAAGIAKQTARDVLSRPFEARNPLLVKAASLSPTIGEQVRRVHVSDRI